jgi:hypothetical protein
MLPRISVLMNPTTGLQLSMSYGRGVRSMDPIYISQDRKTPFAKIDAFETGATYSRTFDVGTLSTRLVGFYTHVGQDLIFSETEGRNTLANGTTRQGVLGALRWSGDFIDQNVNVTYVRSRFDDTGFAIPYVPNWVIRSDTATHHELPMKLLGKVVIASSGVGLTYIGRRPLPYNEVSSPVFTTDASLAVHWHRAQLAFDMMNVFGTRYRLGEYNYASNFQSANELPTLVPVRHFSAGAPRTFYVSFAYTFGELSS